MSLFSKDKEIIFKITNAILLIWLIAAVVFTFSSIINLIYTEPTRDYTFEEYKATNCNYKDETTSEEEYEQMCQTYYNDYKFNNDNSNYYRWKNLYISIANVIIVAGFLFIINRKEDKSNK